MPRKPLPKKPLRKSRVIQKRRGNPRAQKSLPAIVISPKRRWRKPLSYFLNRLFNFDPHRDFGILDEFVGGIIVLVLSVATITVIFGKEEAKTWVHTAPADWTKGVMENVTTIGAGTNASIGLAQEGGGWTMQQSLSSGNIVSVAFFAPTKGFAVGEGGAILRTDDGGRTWQQAQSPTQENLWSVSFASPSVGFVVGDNGIVLEWNGSQWNVIDSPTALTLLGVAVKGNKGIAVGEGGTIIQWDGASWNAVDPSPTEKLLTSVFLGDGIAFATGEEGTLLRWDGTSWSEETSPTTKMLLSTHLFSPSFGMAVGEAGALLVWNGTQWTTRSSPTTRDLNSVRIASATLAFAGGAEGTIAVWDGTQWNVEQLQTTESVLVVSSPEPNEGIAMGSNGLLAAYTRARYKTTGTYTSPSIDAEKEVQWETIQWGEKTGGETTINFQVAANDDNATWDYKGPDGTGTSFYTKNGGETIRKELGKQRYLRYRATFTTSNPFVTPLLHAVTIHAKEEVVEPPPEEKPEQNREEKKEEEKKVTEKVEVEKKEPPKEQPPTNTPPEPTPSDSAKASSDKPPPTPALPAPEIAPLASPETTGGSVGTPSPITPVTTELTLPENNALLETGMPTFQWAPEPEASSYALEIAYDITFSKFFLQQTLAETSFVPAIPLPPVSYFWRVRPDFPPTSTKRGEWTTPFTFTITDKPPLPKVASPVLSEPPTVSTSEVTVSGIAFPFATVRLIITSNIVERTVTADTNGVWRAIIPRAFFTGGQHLIQAQITTPEGQVTPAITVGELFIPFPPPPPKNAAVATARAVQATATKAAEATKKAAKKTVEQTVVVAEKTQEVIKENETETKIALTATMPIVTVANPTVLPVLPNLHILAYHLFSGILSLFGIRKKRKPWGTVYDAITKEPIGLAIVRLMDGGKKLIETQVTDNEGRFGFLVGPGQYTLEVTKQDYAAPSQIVTERMDGDFTDCYHGEALTVGETALNVSIPLDPLNKKETRQKKPLATTAKTILHGAALPLLVIGWTVSWLTTLFAYSTTNLAMTGIYFFFAIVHVLFLPKKFRPWGTVFAASSLEPVPLAVISIIDTKFNRVLKSRLTDYSGRFNFLPPAGEYKLMVKKEGFDFPAKSKPETRKFKNLYFGQDIIVKKEKAIVSTDVPVEKK